MTSETIRDTVKDAIDYELKNRRIIDEDLKYAIAEAVLESLGFSDYDQDEPLSNLRIKINRRKDRNGIDCVMEELKQENETLNNDCRMILEERDMLLNVCEEAYEFIRYKNLSTVILYKLKSAIEKARCK
jgi:hypothetical protein